MNKMPATLTQPIYIQNQHGYFFEIHFEVDFNELKTQAVFECESAYLDSFALLNGIPRDEAYSNLSMFIHDGQYFETTLNDCLHPIVLREGESIEQYLNEWLL